MGIRSWFASNKKEKQQNINQKSFATEKEARLFLNGLIDSYSDDFTVSSPEMSLIAYRTISQLDTVINSIADAVVRSNKILYKIDKLGNKIAVEKNDSNVEIAGIYNILKYPHFLQSENEFWKTLVINYLLHGISNTYRVRSIGYGYKSMMCLSSVDVTAIIKDNVNYLKAKNLKEIIDYYEVDQGPNTTKETNIDKFWTLQKESLAMQNDGYVTPENPLLSIEKLLGTLKIIADIKNELLGNHGAIGIINPDGKDSDGETQTIIQGEKDNLQAAYEDYGIQKGKYKLLITNTAVKFTAISLPIADLLLNEFEEKAEKTLAAKFGVSVSIFGQQSTYENKEVENKGMYENTVIPLTDIITDSFSSAFDFENLNLELKFDYSHITFLQKDKKEEAEKNKLETDNILAINNDVSEGIISRDTAIEILITQGINKEQASLLVSEILLIPDNNENDIPPEQLESQARLRGTVRGVQGILSIQASVAQGVTDYSAALATLVEIYGFNDETAVAILGTPNSQNTSTDE